MEISKVNSKSVGKVFGLMYAFIGVILGVFMTLFASIGSYATRGLRGTGSFPFFESTFGVFSMLIIPVFYGVMGFIMGYISASIYNFVAKRWGGIVVETKKGTGR